MEGVRCPCIRLFLAWMKIRIVFALIPGVAILTFSQSDGIINFVPGLRATQDKGNIPQSALHLTKFRSTGQDKRKMHSFQGTSLSDGHSPSSSLSMSQNLHVDMPVSLQTRPKRGHYSRSGPANLSYKGPESKYFRLWKLMSLIEDPIPAILN